MKQALLFCMVGWSFGFSLILEVKPYLDVFFVALGCLSFVVSIYKALSGDRSNRKH